MCLPIRPLGGMAVTTENLSRKAPTHGCCVMCRVKTSTAGRRKEGVSRFWSEGRSYVYQLLITNYELFGGWGATADSKPRITSFVLNNLFQVPLFSWVDWMMEVRILSNSSQFSSRFRASWVSKNPVLLNKWIQYFVSFASFLAIDNFEIKSFLDWP